MEVFFDSSLWRDQAYEAGQEPDNETGIRREAYFRFTGGGMERIIPCIYAFSKGIVFDVLTPVREDEIKAYFDKYAALEEEAEHLSGPEMEAIMQENPYQDLKVRKIWLNGAECSKYSYSCAGYLTVREEQDRAVLTIKENYREELEDAGGSENFFCQRFCVECRDIDFREEPLKAIKLEFRERSYTKPLRLRIFVPPKETARVEMKDPFTGKTHELYLTNKGKKDAAGDNQRELSFYIGELEIVPPLEEGETLLFDNSLSYRESMDYLRKIEGKDHGQEMETKSVASVSIIGGADGPTSVFLAGKRKKAPKAVHGGSIIPCFSKPFLPENRLEEEAVFIINGIDRKNDKKETVEVTVK